MVHRVVIACVDCGAERDGGDPQDDLVVPG
jgi:hypothetical protein